MDSYSIDHLLHQAQLEVRVRPGKAKSLAQKALTAADRKGFAEQRCRALLLLGRYYLSQSHNGEALEAFYQVLEQNQRLRNDFLEEQSCYYLALTHHRLAQYERVIHYAEMLITSSHESSLVSGRILLTMTALDMGKLRQAKEWLELIDSSQSLHHGELSAEINFLRGRIAALYDEEEAASHAYEDALAWFRENHWPLRQAAVLAVMSQLSLFSVNREELLQESLLLSRTGGDRFHEAECLLLLGKRYHDAGDSARALSYVNQSLDIAASVSAALLCFRAYHLLRDIYRCLGEYDKALDSYESARGIEDGYRTDRCLTNMQDLYDRSRQKFMTSREEILENSIHRMNIISDIGRRITSLLDMEEVLDMVYENVNKLMDAAVFGIGICDEKEGLIRYERYLDRGERITGFSIPMDSKDSFSVWVVKNHHEILSNNLGEDYERYISRYITHSRKKSQSIIYLPLAIENSVIGVLTVQSYDTRAYTEDHLSILQVLGGYLAVALENSRIHGQMSQLNQQLSQEKRELERAYSQIAHMANHDNLTGLANRRLLSELLESYLPRAQRSGTLLALLFIDLDNFKPINDQHGHKQGDRILKVVADRLRSGLRESDIIARVGGDEFVAVLPELHQAEEAEKVAAKIIEVVQIPIPVEESEARLGVSIGISLYPQDDETTDGLMRKADAAMYHIKRTGKNGSCFYSAMDGKKR